MSWSDVLEPYWEILTAAAAVLGPVLSVTTIAWILSTKKNSTSAAAWCLLVLFLPLVGPFFFLALGYQHVNRPLRRKRRQTRYFQKKLRDSHAPSHVQVSAQFDPSAEKEGTGTSWDDLGRLASRCGAAAMTAGNRLEFYFEGQPAFDAMLDALRSARHHIHLETFIFQADSLGRQFLDVLTQKAREGVEVRLLYDAMGTRHLGRRLLKPLWDAKGQSTVFLPVNPLRRRVQINMRNHRKILVVDGAVGFLGGLNIGNEYRSQNPRFGFWRDTHMRIEGPAVSELQRVFMEDWDFAAGESLHGSAFFPGVASDGPHRVQIIESGPDRELKSIREIYFAAILRARRRVWIASPYFVPDEGLLDALCLAGYLGVDVRFLGLYYPDKWLPFCAGRYYWNDVLRAGVKVYQYTQGMMHSKVVLVDDEWASLGSANLDIRSLHLNFETNALIHSAAAVAQLERAFLHDLTTAIRLDRHVYARRPLAIRLLDNACRLLSPVL